MRQDQRGKDRILRTRQNSKEDEERKKQGKEKN